MSENKNLEELKTQILDLKSLVITVLKKSFETSELIDSNFEVLNERINELYNKIDCFEKATGKDFTGVGNKLDTIHHELKKIEKVSRYSEEFENLLKIS